MSDYAELYMASFVAAIDKPAKSKGFKEGDFAATARPNISPLVACRKA